MKRRAEAPGKTMISVLMRLIERDETRTADGESKMVIGSGRAWLADWMTRR